MTRVPLDKTATTKRTDGTLRLAPGRQIVVYERGTKTEATGYTSQTGSTKVTYPLTADDNGRFAAWYPPGSYDLYDPVDDETQPWEAAGLPVHNVVWYGGDPTGQRDSRAAIQDAIDAAEAEGGGIVYFPRGIWLCSDAVQLKDGVQLVGCRNPRWYDDGVDNVTDPDCVIKAAEDFAGGALVYVPGSDGWRIERLAIDGNGQVNTPVYGEGTMADPKMIDVDVVGGTGNGIYFLGGIIEGSFTRVYSHRNGGDGWLIVGGSDCKWQDCYGHSNGGNGWTFDGFTRGELVSCNAEWNTGHGFHCNSSSGDIKFIGCRTDRNWQSGAYVTTTHADAKGRPITFAGCSFHRDGRGGGDQGGLRIDGGATFAGPVIAIDVVTTVGADDDGTGTAGPKYGARINGASTVILGGRLWGETAGVIEEDSGANEHPVAYVPGTIRASGHPAITLDMTIPVAHGDGKLVWNGDTNLYRIGADDLGTDDSFAASGNLTAGRGLATQVGVWHNWDGTEELPGIVVGSGMDTALSRRAAGVWKVRDAFEFGEISDPDAPAANRVRLFARDNGAGKTQLCARFASGAVQVLATEP